MKNKIVDELVKVLGRDNVREDEPLSSYNSIKIGGTARYFVSVSTIENLVKVCKIAQKYDVRPILIGAGTSVVFPDHNLECIVIKNNCRQFHTSKDAEGFIEITAESGALTNLLVKFTVDHGFEGLEYSYGLPGTIGGAIMMNAMLPKYNHMTSDCLVSTKLLTKDGAIREVDKDYFSFSLNKSGLNNSNDIILSVTFRLKKAKSLDISKRANDALTYRMQTQPKVKTTGYTYRNIPKNSDETGGNSIQFISGDIQLDPQNLRYILNTGNGTTHDISNVSKLFGQFLHAQNAQEAYTIQITGAQ